MVLSVIFLYCTVPSNTTDQRTNSCPFDEGAIEDMVGSRIISLGESTHGTGTGFEIRNDLIKYLYSKYGYTNVLFETGYTDVEIANVDLANESLDRYKKTATAYKYYHSVEMESLFQLANSEKDSIKLYGYDIQPQQDTFMSQLNAILPNELNIYKSFWQLNGMYGFAYEEKTDSFLVARKEFKDKALLAIRFIANSTNLDEEKRRIYLEGLRMLIENYEFIEPSEISTYPNNVNYRDSLMYRQILNIVESKPDEKFIILGQNFHIKEGRYSVVKHTDAKWMGHYLSDKYGDDYYSVGMAIKRGEDYDHVADSIYQFTSDGGEYLTDLVNFPGACNMMLKRTSLLPIVDEEKYYKIKGIQGFDGWIIPSSDFDAILFIDHGTAISF